MGAEGSGWSRWSVRSIIVGLVPVLVLAMLCAGCSTSGGRLPSARCVNATIELSLMVDRFRFPLDDGPPVVPYEGSPLAQQARRELKALLRETLSGVVHRRNEACGTTGSPSLLQPRWPVPLQQPVLPSTSPLPLQQPVPLRTGVAR
jgi:hypothetical protein